MRLYTCTGAPSPRRVTLYLAEKGIELETVEVDLRKGEHLNDAFQAKSPECTVPVLELDDGTCLWSSVAIRQYLEAQYPEPPLLGSDSLSRSLVTQWVMWIDHNGFLAAAEAFRNAVDGMRDHAVPGRRAVPQIAELAERGKLRFGHFLDDLDARLAHRDWVAVDTFSVADIDAAVVIDFGLRVTKSDLEGHANIADWRERTRKRPAFAQSA